MNSIAENSTAEVRLTSERLSATHLELVDKLRESDKRSKEKVRLAFIRVTPKFGKIRGK
jgi:hypothetical protein